VIIVLIKNTVQAGDFKQKYVRYKNKKKGLYLEGSFGLGSKVWINKNTVDFYEVIGEEQYRSFSSSVARGVAGASSGKTKGTHLVSIVFKNSKKCLIALDDDMFKNLVIVLY
jgi:hypothetical protein